MRSRTCSPWRSTTRSPSMTRARVAHPASHSVHTAGCHCSSPGTISCSDTSNGINLSVLLPQPAIAPAEVAERILKKLRRSIVQASATRPHTASNGMRRSPLSLDIGDGNSGTCPWCALPKARRSMPAPCRRDKRRNRCLRGRAERAGTSPSIRVESHRRVAMGRRVWRLHKRPISGSRVWRWPVWHDKACTGERKESWRTRPCPRRCGNRRTAIRARYAAYANTRPVAQMPPPPL